MSRVRTKNRIQGRGFSCYGVRWPCGHCSDRTGSPLHAAALYGWNTAQVRTAAAEDWLQTEAFVIGGVGLVSIALALRYGSKPPAARAR